MDQSRKEKGGRMNSFCNVAAATIDRQPLSLRRVLARAAWRGELQFLENAIDSEILRRAVSRFGIRATTDELETAATSFRRERGLLKAADMHRWLADHGWTADDWQAYLEESVEERLLRNAVIRDRINPYFLEHSSEYEAVTFSQIKVADAPTGEALWQRLHEGSAEFHDLARRYSIELLTRPMGGYVPAATRRDIAPAVAAAVFAVPVGELVGPIEVEDGWLLVTVEEHFPARLTPGLYEEIGAQLFAAWLAEQRAQAVIERPLLQHLGGADSQDEALSEAGGQADSMTTPCSPEVAHHLV